MCVDDQLLSAYIDGELSEPWKSQINEHVEWCEACKKRLGDMRGLHTIVHNAMLDDESVGYSQNRVMKYLNSNVLNKEKHTWKQKVHNFVSKKVLLPICTAVLSFCFCLIIFTSPDKMKEIAPTDAVSSLTIENITPVRLTDNYTTIQSLSNYSLEDIMEYLDAMGYDVSISMKGISPIPIDEKKEEIHMTFTPVKLDSSMELKLPVNLSFLFHSKGV